MEQNQEGILMQYTHSVYCEMVKFCGSGDLESLAYYNNNACMTFE